MRDAGTYDILTFTLQGRGWASGGRQTVDGLGVDEGRYWRSQSTKRETRLVIGNSKDVYQVINSSVAV